MAAADGERATNGASHAHVVSFAAAGAAPYDDPMDRVLGLDAKTSGVAAWFGFTSGSTALMAAFGLLAMYMAWVEAHRPRPMATTLSEIEVVREEPPPPPKQEEEKPAPPAPVHVALPREAPPPPPAPAQAAKVITAEPDPKEPVDLTNTIVQGNADSFAGGMTASNGTNTMAVHTMPAPSGVPGGTGPVTAPPVPQGPDRSRSASLGGGGEWSCPFPPEADTAQIDDAYVTLQADVRADGSPTAVRILADPGNGFAREARRCAMNKRYSPALDHDGSPVAGSTRPIRVHFSR
jgi:protein TonB